MEEKNGRNKQKQQTKKNKQQNRMEETDERNRQKKQAEEKSRRIQRKREEESTMNRKTGCLLAALALAIVMSLNAGAMAVQYVDLGDGYYMELPDDFELQSNDGLMEIYFSRKKVMTVGHMTEEEVLTEQEIEAAYVESGMTNIRTEEINHIPVVLADKFTKKQRITYGRFVNDDGTVAIQSQMKVKDTGAYITSQEIFESIRDHTVKKISLNRDQKTMSVGDGFQLTAKVVPDYSAVGIQWTSSDPDVAIVRANGYVIAVGSGSCTITAQAMDGSGKKASCKVKVKDESPVPAKKITLNTTSIKVKKSAGGFSLSAKVKPANADVIWISSDYSVATVDQSGYVTLHGKGSCTIAVYSAADPEVKATCKVKVK